MAENVRELVVTLSLDAGTFSRTCTDINNQIKGVQAEFDAIVGGVDNWQSTMTGREAKLRALNETLELQQTKITAIADELDKAKTALDADPTDVKAARKVSNLETQLNNAKTAAANTKAEIEKLNLISLQQFSQKMTALGRTLKSFGRKFSMYIGGPLAALGIKSFNLAQDYEAAMARLQIATKGSEDTMSSLETAALNMSSEIPLSFVEIVDLMTTLAQADVPVENLENVARVMASLGATSDVGIEESAQGIMQFLTVTGASQGEIENMGSTLLALGNSSVATGADIFAMAQNMAGVGTQAGLMPTEILALAAAFSSFGIEAQAGGTAAGKLMKEMQLAAETGENLEGFANVVGVTGEEFTALWASSPAGTMLSFFDGLASGAADGNTSVLAMLDSLGLTEARLSTLIATAASNPDFFATMLETSNTAWEENTALAEATATAYSTSQAQTDVSLNKMENTAADVGENIVEVLQPVITAVGDLATKFGELDEATQSRWVVIGAALVALGPAAAGIGLVADAVGKLAGFAAKIKEKDVTNFSGLSGALSGFLSTPAGAAIGISVGLTALFGVLKAITTDVDDILAKLGNVPIIVDNTSKKEALAAIAEVQAAADKLSGAALGEEYAGTSMAVKAGYGTYAMFGAAVGYEKELAQRAIADAATAYAPAIADLNQQIGDAVLAGDTELAATLAGQRDARQALWDQSRADAMASYTAAINDLVNGMIGKNPELTAQLEEAGREYDLFKAVSDAMQTNTSEGWASVFTPEVIAQYLPDMKDLDEVDPEMFPTYGEKLSGILIKSLSTNLEAAGKNSAVGTLIQTLLDDPGSIELLDVTALQGALDGAVELLDWKAAGGQGKNLTQGLADGAADGSADLLGPAMNILRDNTVTALQTAFEMQSPSKLMEREGFNISAGVEQAILLGIPAASNAMATLGAALTAIASSQGAAAGSAYGTAFGRSASFRLSLAISDIKRELAALELRISRGYGGT